MTSHRYQNHKAQVAKLCICCRESGVICTTVTFVRENVNQLPDGPALLTRLSLRLCAAAQELGLRHVPSVFEHKHGRLTSMHYRTVAAVLPVIIFDIIPPESPLGEVINATLKWYWAARAKKFTPEGLKSLQLLGDVMRDAWRTFDTPAMRGRLREKHELPKGLALDLPKFHRSMAHVPDNVKRFGPQEYLTTEASESLHKPLKVMFKR